jgi:signal transduction histidine kinase
MTLAAGASGTGSSSDSSPAVAIDDVLVDGRSQKFSAEAFTQSAAPGKAASGDSAMSNPLRISSQAQRLEFRFGPGPNLSNPPVRFRYQMEGVDQDWREAGGEMRLTAKFLDAAKSTVGAVDFVARGETPGWTGNVVDSRYVHHREQVTVPPGAVGMQMELFSGGDEQTTGIMMIDELTISHVGSTNARPETVLFTSRLAGGKDADEPPGVPRQWMRDGSKPAIAQMLKLDPQAPRHGLAVVDTDSKKWGAWRTSEDSLVPVSPGDALELRWNEMYSIGWGGIREASYTYLPPGKYRFRVKAVTEAGAGTGEVTALAITVAPRFWKTSWFLGGTLVVAVGALVTGVRYLTWRKVQSRLEVLERQRAVERERARIARDLHDDLGASLTQIALLSELAKADLAQPELARTHLNQIFAAAGGLARQLNEIVWAVNPANDTLEQFTSHTCKFAQHYLSLAGIRCRLDFPESLPNYPMPAPERHNLFLATKEALHNIVKHAQAGQVWLRLKLDADVLTLLIEDDGRGCDAETVAVTPIGMVGDGLSNMQKRMEQLGGRFAQQSRPGNGTTVQLVLPIRKP